MSASAAKLCRLHTGVFQFSKTGEIPDDYEIHTLDLRTQEQVIWWLREMQAVEWFTTQRMADFLECACLNNLSPLRAAA